MALLAAGSVEGNANEDKYDNEHHNCGDRFHL